MITNLVSDLVNTQNQLGERDSTQLVFKLFNSSFSAVNDYLRVDKTNIGHAFVVGHSTNGIIGVPALGIDGEQITIGVGGLGSTSNDFLIWVNNTYEEYLIDDIFKGSGTAVWDVTDNKIELTDSVSVKDMVSSMFMHTPFTINKLGVMVNYEGGGVVRFYVSANGTESSAGDWEEVSISNGELVEHVLDNPGNYLYWKVELESGVVNLVTVKDDDGSIVSPAIRIKVLG